MAKMSQLLHRWEVDRDGTVAAMIATFEQNDFNMRASARSLDVSEGTLYRFIRGDERLRKAVADARYKARVGEKSEA